MYMVSRYELLKHLRSKRLYGILIIEVVIFVLLIIIPPLAGRDYPTDPAEFAETFFTWTNVLVIIGATFFAGDALVSEFQNRTGYLIFPNPVKRITLFFGKYAATTIIMVLVLAIFYAMVSIASLAITGGFSGLTLSSLGLAILFVLSASSVAYLISSVMKGGTGALVLTFFMFFLILPILDGVFTFARVKPDFSLTFAAGAIQYVMQTPYPTDFFQEIPIGGGQVFEISVYYPDVALAAIVMVAYMIVGIVIGIWFFNKREMAA
jgi:ABC-2 type transport system permease protein